MLKLIQNEYIKIFKKKTTLLFMAIIVIITIGACFLIKSSLEHSTYHEGYYESDYMTQSYVTQQIKDLETYSPIDSKDEIDYLKTVQSLQLYNGEETQYQLLRSIVEQYLQSPQFNTLTNYIVDKNYETLYKELASMYEAIPYTFDGSENAIKNPYQYIIDHKISYEALDPFNQYVFSIVTYQDSLQAFTDAGTTGGKEYSNLKEQYLLTMYRLENNLDIALSDDISMESLYDQGSGKFWTGFKFSASFAIIISVLMIIIAGGIVAEEFSNGTIKFLLINPVKRSKIIISKYLAAISLTAICMIVFYFFNLILYTILYGTGDFGIPLLKVVNDSVQSTNGFVFVASLYLYKTVEVICYATMAFAISSLFRNAAVAIGASVAFLISGSVITQLLFAFRQDWARYLIFANTDLLNIKNGISSFPNHTFTFAVTVIIIHVGVFLLIAYDGFTRKEV